nr:hypothetical protein HmN_000915100 [Hymenolepis microstoma]
MNPSSLRKEYKVGASSAPRKNDESHKDDITAVQSCGISGAFSDRNPPQTIAECKSSSIYDMFGLCGIPSPSKALQWLKHAFLACIDPTSFCANEPRETAAPELPRSESLEGSQTNSTNSSWSSFFDSLIVYSPTNVVDVSTSNTIASSVSEDNELNSNCTTSYSIESNEIPTIEGSTDSQSSLGTTSDTSHLLQIHSQVDSEGSSVDSDNEKTNVNLYDGPIEREVDLQYELERKESISLMRKLVEAARRKMIGRHGYDWKQPPLFTKTVASTSLHQTSLGTMESQSTWSEEEEETARLMEKMEGRMNKYRKKEGRKGSVRIRGGLLSGW